MTIDELTRRCAERHIGLTFERRPYKTWADGSVATWAVELRVADLGREVTIREYGLTEKREGDHYDLAWSLIDQAFVGPGRVTTAPAARRPA